ncbi:MAG: phytanoyl-CoA dioxygenase family protein [Ilumatobacteraceae bacterium]
MAVPSDAAVRDAVEQFHDEGYAIVRGFLPPDEVAELQRKVAELYEVGIQHPCTYRHGNLSFEILPERHFGQRYLIQAYWYAWVDEYFDRMRSHPAFLDVLEPLLGRNIKQVTHQLHWKPPGARVSGYRFHQDLMFREATHAYDDVVRDTVNVGLAIDRATPENGCLRIVPGSHRMGYLGLSDNGSGSIMKGLTLEDELVQVGIDPSSIVDVVLEPGDLAMWGLLTVHGSLPNESQHDRAFAISSYVNADRSQRGEWAFREGEPVLLGPTPQLCKNERLFEQLEPYYDDTEWYL